MGHGGRGRQIPASERAPLRGALAPAMKVSVSYVGNNARDTYLKPNRRSLQKTRGGSLEG